jgi:REP element-mobilizing transposase RayT
VGYVRVVPKGLKQNELKSNALLTSCLMHSVWATKERRRLIKPELQSRLWSYLGATARENKLKALVVGGVEDHVHVLLSIP